jgi:acetyl esterase
MGSTALDPGMAAFAERLAASTPPGFELWPLERQRREWAALCQSFAAPLPDGVLVADVSCNGVPCRIYRPDVAGPVPAVIYGHGGGWVLGGIGTHHDMCAELAVASGTGVILMDYRLAPEHPYPAQLQDSLNVWHYVREYGAGHGLDCSRILAAGDSAGGQMSVALALALAEQGLPQLAGLLLIYPVLGCDMATPSYIRNAQAPCLTREEMAHYLEAFLGPPGGPAWRDGKAVPLLAEDLRVLPPTAITVAGHDPLHDDGVMFALRLDSLGIASILRSEPALAHSYMRARHHSVAAQHSFAWTAKSLAALAKGTAFPPVSS